MNEIKLNTSPTIERLKSDWRNMTDETDKARLRLEEAALSAFDFKVADIVRVVHRDYGDKKREETGKITKLTVHVHYKSLRTNDDEVRVEVSPTIYPLKKDGTPAKVGEIYMHYDSKLELVERPEAK